MMKNHIKNSAQSSIMALLLAFSAPVALAQTATTNFLYNPATGEVTHDLSGGSARNIQTPPPSPPPAVDRFRPDAAPLPPAAAERPASPITHDGRPAPRSSGLPTPTQRAPQPPIAPQAIAPQPAPTQPSLTDNLPASLDETNNFPTQKAEQQKMFQDAGGLEIKQNESGIAYISGGVGADESAYLESLRDQFNTALLFAEKTGAFIANIDVTITDSNGKKLLSAKSHGPHMLINLPAGQYRITASFGNISKSQNISAIAGRQQKFKFWW